MFFLLDTVLDDSQLSLTLTIIMHLTEDKTEAYSLVFLPPTYPHPSGSDPPEVKSDHVTPLPKAL